MGPPVVDDDGPGIGVGRKAEPLVPGHLIEIVREVAFRHPQVEKTGTDRFHRRESGIAHKPGGDGFGNFQRGLVEGLGSRHGAVALKFAEVGPVGKGDLAIGGIEAGGGEGRRNFAGDEIDKLVHSGMSFLVFPELPNIIADKTGHVQYLLPKTGKGFGSRRTDGRSERRRQSR